MRYTVNNHPTSLFSSLFNDVANVLDNVSVPNNQVPVNILKTEEGYTLEIFVPGIKKEEVALSVDDNKLKVAYKHQEDKEVKYLKREFVRKDFERVFDLPNTVDVEVIQANFDQGVLTISLPKSEKAAKKTIEIV
ncbi:Hsp20/alpha crystallin family protein [Flammeovirga sp. MY04]|uniref:Hsp20/alpha crystallin family protein n=1 Tax=Flammeovirga sp. MY04 TaxID=1191459 RepID=UPI0008063A0C|nr:Hsp20/alpha crystallin family protein [Flammeovirga sp. MY04]ANQ50271.1 Hsp20/alpha crystallin family protein [Flammeovirga sp. MY04]